MTIPIALLVESFLAVLALEEFESKVHQLVVEHVALLSERLQAALEGADELLVVSVGDMVPPAPGFEAARHDLIQLDLEAEARLA